MNLVAPVDLIHDVDGNTSAEFSVRLNGFPKYRSPMSLVRQKYLLAVF